MRTDQLQIGSTGIAVSQVLSAVLVIGGVIGWIILFRKSKKTAKEVIVEEKVQEEKNDI